MAIIVTGYSALRTRATATVFGVIEWRPQGDAGPVLRDIGRSRIDFAADPSRPGRILDDEDVVVEGSYRPSAADSGSPVGVVGRLIARLAQGWLSRLRAWLLREAVVEVTSDRVQWTVAATLRKSAAEDARIDLAGRLRLPRDVVAFRVRVSERLTGVTHASLPYQVNVGAAPAILTFIGMGGSSSIGSGSSTSSSSSGDSGSSSGSSGSSGSSSSSSGSSNSGGSSSSGDGITVDPAQCTVDPTLIAELMEPANVQCNDLCADCLNFIEHLGLRLLEEEDLASVLESLRHKEDATQSDFCARRTNPRGISNRVVLGKWENSEHEPFRPGPIKTFESILDEYEADGGGALIIVAQSHAGAKLAATVSDKWRWGSSIAVELFVAWDATHFGGAIGSLGTRPRRIVNFYQQGNLQWWQNGSPITGADLEFNLTGCFSHNAIARSAFVHQASYDEVRRVLAQLRTDARNA